MQNDPRLLFLMIAIGGYVAKLWFDDFRARRNGRVDPRALPGATEAPKRALVLASLGAGVLLAAETAGEHVLGIVSEQSKMTVLFAVYTLVAAIIEEIVFRGFIVVETRGKVFLWGSIFGASLLFAGLHPFLWQWEGSWPWSDGKLLLSFTTKAWFSTGAIFVGSLWFYAVRFFRPNPAHSLLPCFAAHATKNLGVIAIKAAQGFLVGLW